MSFSPRKHGFSLAQVVNVVIETAFCFVPRGSFATSSFKIQGKSQSLCAPNARVPEQREREQKWPSWHPFLPFLGDEVTGKTVAIIGTGRIGLAMIKKCSGFDMNILCYDPAYQNHEYIAAIQETMDLRQARGIQKEKTSIKYVDLEEGLRSGDYVSIHVPLLREGETDKPTYHLINEKTLKLMNPTTYLINRSRA